MAERHVNPAARVYVVNVPFPYRGLNVRTGPGTEHSVLHVLPDGAKVEATGRSRKGWLPVSGGWADKTYLKEV